jgi:hypothetical protein
MPRIRRGTGLFVAAGALVAVSAWLARSGDALPASAAALTLAAEPAQPLERSAVALTARAQPEVEAAVPADEREPRDAVAAPHPASDRLSALRRERQLIGALNDALDLSQPDRMRTLVAELRAVDPRDDNRLQAGYERIADCFDRPRPESEAAARQYYEQERASTLRRYVRRHCLER